MCELSEEALEHITDNLMIIAESVLRTVEKKLGLIPDSLVLAWSESELDFSKYHDHEKPLTPEQREWMESETAKLKQLYGDNWPPKLKK